MIKKFKIFEYDSYAHASEPDEDDLDSPENLIYTNAGYYIQSQLPKEEFVDWEFSRENVGVEYTFYFDEDSDEDVIINIDDFLSQHNIDYKTDYSTSWRTSFDVPYNDKPRKYMVLKFTVPFKLVDYFAGLYSETNKYNL